MRTVLLCAAAALALAACTEPEAPQPTTGGFIVPSVVVTPAPDFVGMSEQGVRGCLGPPTSETVSVLEGPTRWMFYRTGLGADMCKVALTVRNGRVVDARYSDFQERVLTDLAACTPLFERC